MEELYGYYKNDATHYKTYGCNDTCEYVEVTDIPISEASGSIAGRTTSLHNSELENWLLNKLTLGKIIQDNGNQFRMVWVPLYNSSTSQITKPSLDLILKNFQIDSIFDYSRTSYNGFVNLRVGRQTDLTESYSLFLNGLGSFMLGWSYNAGTGSTQVLCLAAPWIMSRLKIILGYQSTLLCHPMAVAYIVTIFISQWLDDNLLAENIIMCQVEDKTCYFSWRPTSLYRTATDDYGALSPRVSGSSITLALAKEMAIFARGIMKLAAKFSAYEAGQTLEFCKEQRKLAGKIVQEYDSFLLARLDMQEPRVDCMVQRAHIQQTALLNLIAQNDSKLSIALGKDSRTLASASKRDSSSMKTLAAVTVAFLPATFVASLFSMPLFNWDATTTSQVVDGRFWIYWAVTAPLTITTLVIWLSWTHRQSLIYRAQDRKERNQLLDEVNGGRKHSVGGDGVEDDRSESGDVG